MNCMAHWPEKRDVDIVKEALLMREGMAQNMMMPGFLTTADAARAAQRLNRQRSRAVGENDINVDVPRTSECAASSGREVRRNLSSQPVSGTLAETRRESLGKIGLRTRTRQVLNPRYRRSAVRETMVPTRRSGHGQSEENT